MVGLRPGYLPVSASEAYAVCCEWPGDDVGVTRIAPGSGMQVGNASHRQPGRSATNTPSARATATGSAATVGD